MCMYVHFCAPHPFLWLWKLRKHSLRSLLWRISHKKKVELVGMSSEEHLGNKLNEDKDSLKVIKFSLW